MLEIGCGSGHSLKYHADRNAGELWGVDISRKQLENAEAYLKEHGYTAKLICAPMEANWISLRTISTTFIRYMGSAGRQTFRAHSEKLRLP